MNKIMKFNKEYIIPWVAGACIGFGFGFKIAIGIMGIILFSYCLYNNQ